MDRKDIKVGMKVVCKEAHYNEELRWRRPEMDEAIGKPMTVIMIYKDGLVYCGFETSLKYDDGNWCFMSEWLEPWTEEKNDNNREINREEFMNIVYSELNSDSDNNRANRIIDAADEYVDATMESLIRRLMNEYDDILSVGDGIIKRLKAIRKEEINNGN